MKGSCQISVLAMVVAVIGCRSAKGSTHEPFAEETLCIHLYNFAQVAPETVKRAMAQTARVFTGAGIRTTWEQPSADSPEAHNIDLSGLHVKSLGSGKSPCLVLTIVQHTPSTAYAGALGFAAPFARFGINVELFYDRIDTQAEFVGIAADVLLAYSMAHEIGHVMLRSSAHSSVGLMRARCDRESWRLASLGMMAFLPEQAKQMRQELSQWRPQEQRLSAEPDHVLAETQFALHFSR